MDLLILQGYWYTGLDAVKKFFTSKLPTAFSGKAKVIEGSALLLPQEDGSLNAHVTDSVTGDKFELTNLVPKSVSDDNQVAASELDIEYLPDGVQRRNDLSIDALIKAADGLKEKHDSVVDMQMRELGVSPSLVNPLLVDCDVEVIVRDGAGEHYYGVNIGGDLKITVTQRAAISVTSRKEVPLIGSQSFSITISSDSPVDVDTFEGDNLGRCTATKDLFAVYIVFGKQWRLISCSEKENTPSTSELLQQSINGGGTMIHYGLIKDEFTIPEWSPEQHFCALTVIGGVVVHFTDPPVSTEIDTYYCTMHIDVRDACSITFKPNIVFKVHRPLLQDGKDYIFKFVYFKGLKLWHCIGCAIKPVMEVDARCNFITDNAPAGEATRYNDALLQYMESPTLDEHLAKGDTWIKEKQEDVEIDDRRYYVSWYYPFGLSLLGRKTKFKPLIIDGTCNLEVEDLLLNRQKKEPYAAIGTRAELSKSFKRLRDTDFDNAITINDVRKARLEEFVTVTVSNRNDVVHLFRHWFCHQVTTGSIKEIDGYIFTDLFTEDGELVVKANSRPDDFLYSLFDSLQLARKLNTFKEYYSVETLARDLMEEVMKISFGLRQVEHIKEIFPLPNTVMRDHSPSGKLDSKLWKTS